MSAATISAAAPHSGVWRRECAAEVRMAWRMPQFLLPTVLTPAAFYGLFTIAIAKAPSPAIAAASLAGYGVFAAIGPALFGFGAGVAMEREQGRIELKRVSPMPPGAFVAAKLCAALSTTAAALALIYLLGILAGVRLTPERWALLAAVHLGSTVPHALIGLGVGMRMGGKGAVAIANALFLVSAVIGGLWIPSAYLPHWMQAMGQASPAFHLGQLARAVVGADTIGQSWVHAATIAAMTVAAALWAWSGWRRSPA
jgi:ABC-2 type transport system permease protein